MAAEDTVTLYPWSILTETQFGYEANIGEVGSGNEQIGRIRDILNTVTDLVEHITDRIIMYRGTHDTPAPTTRYYSRDVTLDRAFTRDVILRNDASILYLDEWPVRNVVIHETTARIYDATTLLTLNTDYVLESSARRAKVIRTLAPPDGPRAWGTGFRSIQVTAEEGFRRSDQTDLSNDLLPGEIKKAAARIAARMWAEVKRQKHGVMSATDAAGTMTRFSESYISITDAGILRNHARQGMGGGRRGNT